MIIDLNFKGLMHLQWVVIFLFLASCTSPVYQNTTYDVEEFIADSNQINRGKQSILELEEREETPCPSKHFDAFEEMMIDGDELTIALYYPSRPDRVATLEMINKTTGFRVCDGSICLPCFSKIEVEGLTLREVREKVQAVYCTQLPQAQIFVNFKKRYERQVQIIGASTSMITVRDQMRLSEVLAKAKISFDANLFKSYVMRDGQQLPLDLYKLIHEGDESQNIVMRGGDQIFIANSGDATLMVTGEVPRPQVIPVPYGFLSLREAVVKAGGIPFNGDKGCIQVIRGDFTRPKIYCLKWKDITHLPNQSLLLIPGDVIVISEKPITQWNRFINQAQPSATGMGNAYSVYQIFKAVTD
jgi:polysaccharide export outer membrane protein